MSEAVEYAEGYSAVGYVGSVKHLTPLIHVSGTTLMLMSGHTSDHATFPEYSILVHFLFLFYLFIFN